MFIQGISVLSRPSNNLLVDALWPVYVLIVDLIDAGHWAVRVTYVSWRGVPVFADCSVNPIKIKRDRHSQTLCSLE